MSLKVLSKNQGGVDVYRPVDLIQNCYLHLKRKIPLTFGFLLAHEDGVTVEVPAAVLDADYSFMVLKSLLRLCR